MLLTNIELTRTNKNSNEFLPFEMYKSITKSLEHVHAQNIEDINENKREEWFGWLDAHTAILLSVTNDKAAVNILCPCALSPLGIGLLWRDYTDTKVLMARPAGRFSRFLMEIWEKRG